LAVAACCPLHKRFVVWPPLHRTPQPGRPRTWGSSSTLSSSRL